MKPLDCRPGREATLAVMAERSLGYVVEATLPPRGEQGIVKRVWAYLYEDGTASVIWLSGRGAKVRVSQDRRVVGTDILLVPGGEEIRR